MRGAAGTSDARGYGGGGGREELEGLKPAIAAVGQEELKSATEVAAEAVKAA